MCQAFAIKDTMGYVCVCVCVCVQGYMYALRLIFKAYI